jgi:aldehyde:ferredoxin oxidoreductase
MANGYMGKIMWVDLSTGKIETEEIADEVYQQVLTGTGLAARLLYDRIPANADPLGPKNILAFMSGLLTGSGAFFSGRWMVAGKSPLTGGWGDANCGGNFSPAIKRCGVDGIFFKGVSKKPVVLKIIDGEAELVDAGDLWGMDAIEAEKKMIEDSGKKNARVAVIGPAGEKVSLISGVVNDGGRIAARSGLGAVMGSKKLKGIVLASKGKIPTADSAKIKELNKKFNTWLKKGLETGKYLGQGIVNKLSTFMRVSPMVLGLNEELVKITFRRYGTITTNTLSSENGDSPCKNWKGAGSIDYPLRSHSSNINPALITAHEKKKYSCFSCPLGCGGLCEIEIDGKMVETHKPEYETCCAFGTLLLNKDLKSIFILNDMLNRAGMDTISAGGTVGFAIECLEQGVLGKDDLDGIDLSWGNAEGVIAFVQKMIDREGCGELFADGSKAAAEKIGKGSDQFAMHAGGQELAMHDTRFDPGFAVSYTMEPTPGRHTNHGYQWLEMFALHRVFKGLPKMPMLYRPKERYNYSKDKNTLLVAGSKYMQFANGCGMCLFGMHMGGRLPVPEFVNAATGWNYTAEDFLKMGERIQALRQAFNAKHGLKPRVDFKLPRRTVGLPPLEAGPLKGVTLDEDKLLDDFCEGMGWDTKTGAPTADTLKALGLPEVAKELYG